MANEKQKADEAEKTVTATCTESFSSGTMDFVRGGVYEVPQSVFDKNDRRFSTDDKDVPSTARRAGTSAPNQADFETKPKAEKAEASKKAGGKSKAKDE